MQPAKELQVIRPLIVEAVTLFNRMEEIQQQIAQRAYELFEARGRDHGRDFEDWTRAEAELLTPIQFVGNETDNALEITAEVPGFSAKDIEVAVEPRRLFVSGKTETTITPDNNEDQSVTQQQTAMFFRAIDLPVEIDATKAEAQFDEGRLTLTLPKLATNETNETNSQASAVE
jgi:HSP20 family protein